MMPNLPDSDHIISPPCRICKAVTQPAGTVYGHYSKRNYQLARCDECGYAFVTDPWLDFTEIYDEHYYNGRGADPLVDYHFELDYPERTVRRYEWEGIASIVNHLAGGPKPSRRWLDYGCGNGCLVRYLRGRSAADAFGFDEGSITTEARARGVPILAPDDLLGQAGSFDVVTAIEVLEHTLDPLAELRRMRHLLRPGGLLFLTTGNARPYADRLNSWRYVIPEIHISFFEPRTLEQALTAAGFQPERRSMGSGLDKILKFKALKNLHMRRRSPLIDMLPSRVIGPLADHIAKLSEHPVGWAS